MELKDKLKNWDSISDTEKASVNQQLEDKNMLFELLQLECEKVRKFLIRMLENRNIV